MIIMIGIMTVIIIGIHVMTIDHGRITVTSCHLLRFLEEYMIMTTVIADVMTRKISITKGFINVLFMNPFVGNV